jgi:mRNA interferase MazF
MRRGEVWWVTFDPSVGSEIRKRRPAIIVSNDSANRFLRRVQVVPLTSNTAKLYPGEAYVMLNGERRKAMANQLTTVSKLRIADFFGQVSDVDLIRVEHAIRVQLNL